MLKNMTRKTKFSGFLAFIKHKWNTFAVTNFLFSPLFQCRQFKLSNITSKQLYKDVFTSYLSKRTINSDLCAKIIYYGLDFYIINILSLAQNVHNINDFLKNKNCT